MSNTITLREFITKWGFEVDDKALEKLDDKFSKTRESMNKLSGNIAAAGAKMSLFVTAPFLAFGGASANAAAEAIDVSDKFTAIFKSLGEDGVSAAKSFADSVGVSNVEGQRLLSTQGQILKSMGFTEKQAFSMASAMGTLSADLAEFNSLEGGAAEAGAILKAAMSGQTRGLKQLGVSIDEDTIKKKVQQQAANGVRFQTLKQAEAAAILAIVQEKTKDATGAFADSQDEMGVKMQRARARLANITVSFGRIFLPVVLKVLDKVGMFIEWIDGMSTGTKTFIVVIGGLVAAIGPLLLALSSVLNSIMVIRTAMVLFGNSALIAWAKALGPVLLWAAALAGIGLVVEDVIAYFQGKNSMTGVIIAQLGKAFDWLEEKFGSMPGWIQSIVVLMTAPFRALIATIRAVAGALGALTQGNFREAGNALLEGVKDMASPIYNVVTGQGTSIQESMGFGRRATTVQPSIPQVSNSPLMQQPNVTQNVNSPIQVTVPLGTPPDKVGPYIQKGVGDGMGQLLRETSRATKTAVSN